MALSEATKAALVRRPDNNGHFMRIKPVERLVLVTLGDTVLAQTVSAKRVLEVGGDLYDPVLYFPRADILAQMQKTETSTNCPLKGMASYYSAKLMNSEEWVQDIAWSYEETFDFADELKGLIAFDTSRVAITEAPNV